MFSIRATCEVSRCLASLLVKQPKKLSLNARHYAAPRNRFFKKTSILQNEGLFEVTLDHRKLKTPQGNVFRVPSESLARAVAVEWDSQKEKIDLSTMFLTGICSNAIDNPGNVNKYQLVDHMIKFLDTDTVLFFSPEEDELYDLQMREWNPIIQWACERFKIEIKPSHDIAGPNVSHESREILRRYFLSYDQWSLTGYSYGVDTMKSLILMLACAERFVSVEKAVLLSRLEEEFQCKSWGRVEWAHDVDMHQTITRLAAAMFFVHSSVASKLSVMKKSSRAEEMVMP
ncbi:ATP synthase mitochondrial F1 complex assembly factor 2 [Ischnura elegans]|uniref:ATP synthase mitochondrial F1 complex assembly factor 2 n=1 Tax=Ischnura elegans TaxID=197161 RepID=UPI001ED8BAC8|nr:ATP synthase mitochondrial F1 complex assembly factor 2 [Ischnura elegans]